MHTSKISTALATLVLLLGLVGTPVLASAHDGSDDSTSGSDDNSSTQAHETETEVKDRIRAVRNEIESHRQMTDKKLSVVKQKVCKLRESHINNIMGRIAERGQKQLDLFTTIATRVEDFYTEKGKVLSNYDQLVADVNSKKTDAQTAVGLVQSQSVEFKCDGTDPKGSALVFKDALKAEISALKNYRTSVKNLIVGVKSVQSTDTGDTSGGSE